MSSGQRSLLANQSIPSAPTERELGFAAPPEVRRRADGRSGTYTIAPLVLTRPRRPSPANQRSPPGPGVRAPGPRNSPVGSTNVVIAPEIVMRPMRLLPALANQRLPSAPTTRP